MARCPAPKMVQLQKNFGSKKMSGSKNGSAHDRRGGTIGAAQKKIEIALFNPLSDRDDPDIRIAAAKVKKIVRLFWKLLPLHPSMSLSCCCFVGGE